MSTEKITAELRTEFGKGAARRIRREDKVPAVVYGHGNDPVHLTLPGHETMMALKHGGANALLELDVDGETHLALTKQVQVDPIRRVLEHVDFVVVRRGEKVTVDVPIHVVGDAVSDGVVVTENATLQVEAEATHIPEFFEVSVEDAQVGFQLAASDVELPSGTTLLTEPETLIVHVTMARVEEEPETDEAEAEVEGEETAEGEGAEGGDEE
jgi:large subunit ribosomal protein L25